MSLRLGAMLLLAVMAALVLGCGGGSERSLSGQKTSPSPSGTAPIFQRSPVRGSPTASAAAGTPTASPAGQTTPNVEVNVTPVAVFKVKAKETTNIRSDPFRRDTQNVLGVVGAGETREADGISLGDEVDPGNNKWYRLKDGGFVYSGLFEVIEGQAP